MFKTQVEPRAAADLFFIITRKIVSGISFIFPREIVKTKSAVRVALQIPSFSWSILSSTIALNQSALENSDSYCKFPYRCEMTQSGAVIARHMELYKPIRPDVICTILGPTYKHLFKHRE